MDQRIKYVRTQVGECVIVEFINGSRACSCGMERGSTPNLREHVDQNFYNRYGFCRTDCPACEREDAGDLAAGMTRAEVIEKGATMALHADQQEGLA